MSKSIKSNGITVTVRANTTLVEAYVWAGHQSSAAEGPVQVVRVIGQDINEALSKLRARWESQVGGSSYIGFGGQFRNHPHMTRKEIEERLDGIVEALETADMIAV